MYRVFFSFMGRRYYTEWFDYLDDAMEFVHLTMESREVAPIHVENRDGEIV